MDHEDFAPTPAPPAARKRGDSLHPTTVASTDGAPPSLGRYRPPDPRSTTLYRLVETHCDTVKMLWEERFEPRFGFWRGFVDDTISRHLDSASTTAPRCGGRPPTPTTLRLSTATHPLPTLLRPVATTMADLISRIYETDPLVCPRCGDEMRIIASITDRPVVRRILGHLDDGPKDRSPP